MASHGSCTIKDDGVVVPAKLEGCFEPSLQPLYLGVTVVLVVALLPIADEVH